MVVYPEQKNALRLWQENKPFIRENPQNLISTNSHITDIYGLETSQILPITKWLKLCLVGLLDLLCGQFWLWPINQEATLPLHKSQTLEM